MSIEKIDRNGIIILYKEQDWTSFDVVAKRRGILGTRKVGHSGTLDPMATGVLPLFMGRATKAVDMQVIKDKEYGTFPQKQMLQVGLHLSHRTHFSFILHER